MKQKIGKPVEIAVIFQRNEFEKLTYFIPKYIEVGYLDEETMQFINLDGNSYKHLLIKTDIPYGFGLRCKLTDLKELYGLNDTKILFKLYLKHLKERKYYFGIYPNNKLKFVSEDKKYHHLLVEPDQDLETIIKSTDPFSDISKLISNIKDNVVGQDEAVEELVAILWRNSMRENKNNVLLVGPTGVGKTQLIRIIQKYLNIPITTIDVSGFTRTGYQGSSVGDILKRVINNCGGNIIQAQKSIVVLDEFDKLAKDGAGNEKIATEAVQQELLKLLEDGEYVVDLSEDFFCKNEVTINTKGITFIVAGAFSKLFTETFESKKISGFSTNSNSKKELKRQVTTEDLIKCGIIEEAVGRIHNIIVLNSLTKENLIDIMKNPNNYMLNENIKIFNNLGITVHIDEEVYEKIAKQAFDKKIGARGLVGSIENLFDKASLEAKINSQTEEYNYLEITKETVEDNRKYTLKKVLTKKEDN